ncbi:hypothetical protein B0H14DRAFT_3871758 [Mycena olivaceomarginata]|nr:hypothetical protein B0H14DRAFT_3871758 [Mycena olivaceomarginata]
MPAATSYLPTIGVSFSSSVASFSSQDFTLWSFPRVTMWTLLFARATSAGFATLTAPCNDTRVSRSPSHRPTCAPSLPPLAWPIPRQPFAPPETCRLVDPRARIELVLPRSAPFRTRSFDTDTEILQLHNVIAHVRVSRTSGDVHASPPPILRHQAPSPPLRVNAKSPPSIFLVGYGAAYEEQEGRRTRTNRIVLGRGGLREPGSGAGGERGSGLRRR